MEVGSSSSANVPLLAAVEAPPDASAPPPRAAEPATSDAGVCAVFAVHFHPTSGHTLEWQHPEGLELAGVEFKAMASGQHALETDYVYFRHGELFGLAAFHNHASADPTERHARMRSVGVLGADFRGLHAHLPELEAAARGLNARPRQYDALLALYAHASRAPAPPLAPQLSPLAPPASAVGPLAPLVDSLGDGVFVLWKAALLRMRVLLYGTPPVGALCSRALAALHLLATATLDARALLPKPRAAARFCVSVADADALAAEGARAGYVACTVDGVLTSKHQLWDVLVDGASVRVSGPAASLLAVTSVDRSRLRYLASLRESLFSVRPAAGAEQAEGAGARARYERVLRGFFCRLNDTLLGALAEKARGAPKGARAARTRVVDVGELGLDPPDAPFVSRLAALGGLPLEVRAARCTCMCCHRLLCRCG